MNGQQMDAARGGAGDGVAHRFADIVEFVIEKDLLAGAEQIVEESLGPRRQGELQPQLVKTDHPA